MKKIEDTSFVTGGVFQGTYEVVGSNEDGVIARRHCGAHFSNAHIDEYTGKKYMPNLVHRI